MIVRFSARVIATLAIILLTGVGALQTPWMKLRVSRWLEAALSTPGEFEVSIDGLGGLLPFSISAGRLSFADADGPWLVISSLRLDTIPSELWRGRVVVRRARAERLRLARLPISGAEEENGEPPAFLRALLVDELQVFDVRVGSQLFPRRSDGGEDVASEGAVWSAPAELRASGRYGFHTGGVRAEYALVVTGIDADFVGYDGVGAASARLSGSVRGVLPLAEMRARLELDQAHVPALAAATAQLVIETEPHAATSLQAGSLDVSISARAGGTRGSDERWRALLGSDLLLSARAVFEPSARRLTVAAAHLSVAGATVRTRGYVQAGDQARLEAEAELRDLEAGAPVLAALLGDRARATAVLARSSDGSVRIDDFEFSAVDIEASANLSYEPASKQVAGVVVARFGDDAAIARASWARPRGELSIEARVAGTIDALLLDAVADTTELRLGGGPELTGNLRLRARGLPGRASGEVDLELSADGVAVRGTSALTWHDRAGLEISALRLDGARSRLRGAARFDPAGPRIDGHFELAAEDLSLLAPLVDIPLSGAADVDVELSTGESGQVIEVRASGDSLAAETSGSGRLEIGRGELDVHIDDAFDKPGRRMRLQISSGRLGDVAIDEAGVTVHERDGAWAVDGQLSGRYFDPFALTVSCNYARGGDGWRLGVDRFEAAVGDSVLALRRSLGVSGSVHGDGFAIEDLDLSVDAGRISGRWHERAGVARGRILVHELPAELLGYVDPTLDLHGSVSGELVATSEGEARENATIARMAVEGRGLTLASGGPEPRPIDLRLEIARGVSELRAGLHLGSGAGNDMELTATLPLLESTSVLAVAVDRTAAVTAGAHGSADIGGLLALGADDVGGHLEVDLDLLGTLADPRLRGGVSVAGGQYTNAVVGARYRDIELAASADGLLVRLESFGATDGGRGTIRAVGELDLSEGLGAPEYRFEVALKKMRIIDLDEIEVRAGGVVEIVNDEAMPRISGRLDVETAEVTLPERLPPEIITLDVVELNELRKRSGRLAADGAARSAAIALDLRLVADGRVFVRSRDFDSEWKGDVVVTGTTVVPVIDGELTLVRGDLDAFGIRLQAKRGTIGFAGGDDIDPSVHIVAESARNGIVGRVVISGSASAPRFRLESDPPMPPDEIASRLLFGDSPGQLSPAQSLQLARALARLSGRRGVDPLGWIRRRAALDLLQINGGEEGVETSVVSVGKYVRRGVFVSINQGLGTQRSSASVAVDVTDHFKVESEIGSNATSSIGVTWGWDY